MDDFFITNTFLRDNKCTRTPQLNYDILKAILTLLTQTLRLHVILGVFNLIKVDTLALANHIKLLFTSG